MSTLFSDFLTALRVKHTEDYSDRRFEGMSFQSMFGISNLLKEYGVGTVGVNVGAEASMQALSRFPVPFLADTADGFAIVLKVEHEQVTYMSQHKTFTVPISEFDSGWNGISLLAATDDSSIEPEYMRHHIGEVFQSVKHCAVIVLATLLVGFAMWQSGLCSQWAAWLLLAFNCIGIWLSWMLVQKSLGIHTSAAEAVCSVLEEGGCDEIAHSEAASFLGIFKWSEVGLAYFSISLLAMLLIPQTLPVLAAINILCLPYTVWSISYQKFKAKVWCTLCVCVQATLWALFATYLLGGWTYQILPLTDNFWIDFLVLGCCYVVALLGINWLDESIIKYLKTNSDQDENS